MKGLDHFSIPIVGLKNGMHEYSFSLDKEFFSAFEKSPVKSGKFEVTLDLDKRSDLIKLEFDIQGSFETPCDRCMADIDYPMTFDDKLLVKYADEPREEEQVIYITRDTHHLNVSKFIYELICLHLPLIKVYECREEEPYPCNEVILDKLDALDNIEESPEESKNPIWDSLDEIKFKN